MIVKPNGSLVMAIPVNNTSIISVMTQIVTSYRNMWINLIKLWIMRI